MSEIQRYPASAELRAEWDRLLQMVPDAARMAITPELWNQDWLHRLDLPEQDVAINDLAWLFDVPLWALDGAPFQVTPNEVRSQPHQFAAQYKRTLASSLTWPIHIMRYGGRWIVLDGVHRLLKADMLGEQTIRAMVLSEEDYAGIVFPSGEQ